MTRICLATLLAFLVLAGCNGPSAPPSDATEKNPATSDGASDTHADSAADTVNMTGSMTLKFFEPDMEGKEAHGATFEVSSPQCSLMEDGVWALTPATAIIYGKDGEETRFEAGSAQFDDNSQTASLKDGVKVDIGMQHVELQDMTWSNGEGLARSGHALNVVDGDTKLTAQGMEFHSDTQTMILKQVTGTVSLEEGTPSS